MQATLAPRLNGLMVITFRDDLITRGDNHARNRDSGTLTSWV